MSTTVAGIHHVTAMAGRPQANVDFYTRTLGLRLVKQTVNFDDPYTYHFYYGGEDGAPGTVLTFFPWGADAHRGRIGTGQVSVTAFSIPSGTIGEWIRRLSVADVDFEGPSERFGEPFLSFHDPDGIALELVETTDDARDGWSNGDVRPAEAVKGFHHATLSLEGFEQTAQVLTGMLGFHDAGSDGNRYRFAVGDGGPGATLDLLCEPGRMRGTMGSGVVHHIAFRAENDDLQQALRHKLIEHEFNVTPVIDRQYFRSIYFREPGGVLFEIATDSPGFLIDEQQKALGTSLRLPSWLEPNRTSIERRLAQITVPKSNNPEIR